MGKWTPLVALIVFIVFAIVLGSCFALLNFIPIVNIFTRPLYSMLNGGLWLALFITIFIVTIRMACQ